MKRFGKIAVCLVCGLALNAGLRADELAVVNSPSAGNPYAGIAVRNIFGLNPPAPPGPVEDPLKNLPKITLTGIQSSFGDVQALYKVGPKPGTSGKDQFYMLHQGERQDDVEVVKIDEKNNVVTFDNHGITQELPLSDAPASGGAPGTSPSPAGVNPTMPPGFPRGGGNAGPGGIIRFGGGPGGSSGGTPNSNPSFNSGGPSGMPSTIGSANSLQSHIYQPETTQMSGDESSAILLINHLKAQTEGDPTAPLYPTTPLDKEAGIGN